EHGVQQRRRQQAVRSLTRTAVRVVDLGAAHATVIEAVEVDRDQDLGAEVVGPIDARLGALRRVFHRPHAYNAVARVIGGFDVVAAAVFARTLRDADAGAVGFEQSFEAV